MKDTSFSSTFQLNIKGNLHSFDCPIVMGIINVTPDSFYAGSRKESADAILSTAEQMVSDGAQILDLGGYSSRPGADDISVEEELERVVQAITVIRQTYPDVLLSVDTFRSAVAVSAIEAGASIINDISAGKLDEQMLEEVGKMGVPYIMMHMRGTPQTMKDLTDYSQLLMEVQSYFSERINAARTAGIKDIIIDPGFGFSKTVAQNFEVLRRLETLNLHDCPLLIGVSRKSMIYKTLGVTPEASLNGTTALNAVALSKGARILRVHDVKEAVECVRLYQAIHCEE